MEKEEAEEKLKELEKELKSKEERIKNFGPLDWAGPFKVLIPKGLSRQIITNAFISESVYKLSVKYNIGIFKGCLIVGVLFLIFIAVVLINNFYLKIFF